MGKVARKSRAGVGSAAGKPARGRPSAGRNIRSGRTGKPPRYWSKRVTETSDALDLESGVFAKSTPGGIALSLRRSAESSKRRKTDAFRSAMSMLNFYINRAGRNLGADRLRILNDAKTELRALYGR
jgi:hypothetical protein